MWAVSTVTMLVLAGVLPDFQLESSNGDSATRIAVTAGVGAAVFGLLSSLVWPLLVRALLLVPALVIDIGPRAWWPSALARDTAGHGTGPKPPA